MKKKNRRPVSFETIDGIGVQKNYYGIMIFRETNDPYGEPYETVGSGLYYEGLVFWYAVVKELL